MAYRRYLLILPLLLGFCITQAQVITFESADSTSKALQDAADWQQLIKLGKLAVDNGVDFPALRSRLGYAQLMTGNYSAASREYDRVFKNDSYNQDARYYSYLSHLYLNQSLGAAYNAAHLDTGQLNAVRIKQFAFLNAGFESGIKYNDNFYRGSAFYGRVSLSTRLSWKLQLDQSYFYFNQPLVNRFTNKTSDDRQTEYYAKLSYTPVERLTLFGVYHYLNTNYQNITYNSHILSPGVRYTGTYFDLQADVYLGYMVNRHLAQYNGEVFFYPLGNLNFYTISRVSLLDQNSSNNTIFSQSLGFKVFKNTWLETSATFGRLDNYIGADGLYIYNAIDASTFMLCETGFYELSKHLQIRINYTFENKDDAINSFNYHQHSFTTGLLWKF